MNQSAIIWNLLKAREKSRARGAIGFGFLLVETWSQILSHSLSVEIAIA